MNKRITFIFTVIVIMSSLNISAQEYSNKFDFKTGTGLAFLGSGDVTIYSFENELNYKINNYFSTAVSIGLGRGGHIDEYAIEWGSQDDYFLGSISVFVSPFKNNKRHNFKLGGGYSFFHQAHAYVNRLSYTNQTKNYYYDNTYASLFNIILEYEYRINSRFMIGGKLFTAATYSGGADATGGLIKFGIAL